MAPATARRPHRAVAAALAAVLAAAGCSHKLSSGGQPMEVLFYDLLGMDRGTSYYYEVLSKAHERSDFSYRDTDDPFLADKCVDAIQRLGRAEYTRLEGLVQVVILLSDVAIEDPSALARASAATSLGLLGVRLPTVPLAPRPERGDRYEAALKELDRMHDEAGRRRDPSPAARQRVMALVDEIGSYDFPNLQLTKLGVMFFPARKWVTEERDPQVREVLDRAMTRRTKALVLASLEVAILDRNHNVRVDAVKGLKTLKAQGALDAVLDRVGVETNPWVRGEMAEYLGAVGGGRAAEGLLRLVEDDDGGVRHRARLALARLAGQDLGKDASAWRAWAQRAFPAAAPAPAPAPSDGAPAAAPAR